MISAPIGHPGAARLASEHGERRPRSAGRAARRRGARLPRRGARARGAHRRRSRTSSTRASATAIGVPELYAHQRAAWEAAARGEHLVVTTGTASGKTLAFNLPILDALARTPKHRVLYLYPTKALAQDQFRTLTALRVPKLRPAIYDGDTPTEQRWQIRKWSNAILTNPDMVHIGLLPNHERWGEVLANLRYVVVDEAHVYRGVFGSHVANVLRRLRRIARDLRLRAAVPARDGDDREPGRARRVAARRAGDGDRRRRRAARRAHRRPLEPAAPRRRARPARIGARGGGEAPGGVRRARPADAHLREEPQDGRADPPLHGRAARRRLEALALPRRLHRRAAPRDRAAPRRGRPARRLLDRRARARDRHRPARRGDLGRLPGNGRLAAPAVGPRRAARPRARGARRDRGRARPVLHARAGEAARPARRGGDPRPREPSRPRGPRACGRLRGADRRGATRRSSGPRRSRPRRTTRSSSTPRAATSGAARPRPRPGSRSARPTPTRSRSSTARRARCSASSSARAPTRPSTRAPSTSTSASPTSSRRSTRRRCTPSSSRSAATGTRSRRRRPTRTSSGALREERRAGLDLVFGEVEVTEQVVGYERKTIASQERIELVPLELPAADLRDRGDLVRARARPARRPRRRCRSCSRRSTPPSTR